MHMDKEQFLQLLEAQQSSGLSTGKASQVTRGTR